MKTPSTTLAFIAGVFTSSLAQTTDTTTSASTQAPSDTLIDGLPVDFTLELTLQRAGARRNGHPDDY